ncbi:MAG: hypothetical protein HGB12_01855 [Bacteroidetes bacterium]|nr:hypothetical protein [Bacteroidota bacterium]
MNITTKRTFLIARSIIYAFLTFNTSALLSACFILLTFNCFAQGGAAINTTGNAANNSAMLDVVATNQGMLIPRVALQGTNDVSTISNPANSLLIYNTAPAGTSPDNIIPGFYYYDTITTKWIPFTTGVPIVDPTNLYTIRGW